MSNGFATQAPIDKRSSQRQGLRPTVDAQEVQQQWFSQFETLKDPQGLQGQTHAFLIFASEALLNELEQGAGSSSLGEQGV